MLKKIFSKITVFIVSLPVTFIFLVPIGESAEDRATLQPKVKKSIKNDVSQPLRNITPITPKSGEIREIPLMPLPRKKGPGSIEALQQGADPALQSIPGGANMPDPIQNFEGVDNVNGVLPPDTEGDVGPNHYVQMVNISFAIWDKNGTLLYGPVDNNTLWDGFGGICETNNDGDPIVLYDHLADRWLMSQFALDFPNNFHQCIAISETGDPTGAWHRYDFLISESKMNDYPKFGVWPDGYYMAINQFDGATSFWAGQGVVVFERDQMLVGNPATMVYFDDPDPDLGGMLPSHLDSMTQPPTGSPNYFVQFDDNAWGFPQDQLEIWEFHVDWDTPANSTFTGPTLLPTAAFDSNLCGYSRNCIPQPDTVQRVDAIPDRLMYLLQYRNFDTHESMVVNHTVDAGSDHAGIRWYELRKGAGGWGIHQQGTYAPDDDHRWMGSIAMDGDGNIALGYSVSSNTTYPSIRYSGRLVGDPLGTLPQGETTLIAGGGSQLHSAARWGDYSTMSVDPTDDCTFWYTQEYYETTSSAGWQTRIGSFRFPSCAGTTPCIEDDSGVLDIVGSAGGPGSMVTVPVRIQNAPNDVGSLGFEVVPPSFLAFTDHTRGPLVEDFDFFDCTIPADKPDVVRCGGFKAEGGIGTGSSGDVVLLDFEVESCDPGSSYPLNLQELKDDIANWNASPGCFQCGGCDVSGDGEVTPQDALCAFQKYLGICPTDCGECEAIFCDVNGDNDCTPADALEIFKEYLGLPSICSQ